MAQLVKNLPAHPGDVEDAGSVPGSGRSPGEGNGNPLQYSCLGNPPDRGAWQAITVHGVAKSQTRLSTRTHTSRKNRVALQPFKLYCKWRALTSDNRFSPLPTLKFSIAFLQLVSGLRPGLSPFSLLSTSPSLTQEK